MIAVIVAAWLALSLGFVLGAAWATRKPEPKPPTPPVHLTSYTSDSRWRNREMLDELREANRLTSLSRARQDLLNMLERGKW